MHVLQAQDLPALESFVKLQIGKHKTKTRVLRNNSCPVWNEEFVFRIHHPDEQLVVSVFTHGDADFGFSSGAGDLIGRFSIPVWSVLEEPGLSLPPAWFSLEKPLTGKFINLDCG